MPIERRKLSFCLDGFLFNYFLKNFASLPKISSFFSSSNLDAGLLAGTSSPPSGMIVETSILRPCSTSLLVGSGAFTSVSSVPSLPARRLSIFGGTSCLIAPGALTKLSLTLADYLSETVATGVVGFVAGLIFLSEDVSKIFVPSKATLARFEYLIEIVILLFAGFRGFA